MDRSAWLGLLARAEPAALAEALARLGPTPRYETLRAPQIGLVMARGRAGGEGGAFNLGEATAVRCTIRLDGGQIGVGYVLGRDKEHALRVAICDALLQGPTADRVRETVLGPLAETEAQRKAARAAKAAATKVEFFTLARGED